MFASSGCDLIAPSTQVTNNSGFLINKVTVGGVEFTENLSYCYDGCSTGFIDVDEGSNAIMLQRTASSAWETIGSVGSFEANTHYAVNIVMNGSDLCAELYIRHQTDSYFNDDTTKELIDTVCR
ncbi:MAG: hypothetical protein GY754_29480 [bacterium]|nr:hypothetical protein [bacterium]